MFTQNLDDEVMMSGLGYMDVAARKQRSKTFQSKTKILLLIKLGNFSQNLSTANFCTFSKFSKFNKFYDKPNMFEVFILGGIVF